MGVVRRQYTYRDSIKVSPEDLKLAREGLKTCTIRLGVASVGHELLHLTDGSNRLRVRIQRVETDRVFRQLSDEDAVAEGLGSKTDLVADLRRYYGDIDPQQPVTVIHFRLAEEGILSEPQIPAQGTLWE